MKEPIRFPRIEGITSRQAHADFPNVDGEKTYEREMGQGGFFGPCTHFTHRYAPTAWTDWQGELKPRAFDFNLFTSKQENPWLTDILLSNKHTEIRWWCINQPMSSLVRNGDGDTLLFLHSGSGDLFCDFGHMSVDEGDYIVIPRGTMWRLTPKNLMQILIIEATDSHYELPQKGMVGPHAVFDPAMLDTPHINDFYLQQQNENQAWKVHIKRQGTISTVTFPFNPLDTLGWHGDLSVVRINWRAIRPLMSHRYHLPPSAHTTFVAHRFVICTFVPRPIESDPGALKVPFYHSNDDFDELIFYHKGQFFSRDDINPGMVTLHPSGFAHGPHPGAFKAGDTFERKETDEVAVMIDTRDPLIVNEAAEKNENKHYVHSWKGVIRP